MITPSPTANAQDVTATTAWKVIPSPTDAELSAVQGEYLVADLLPVEDARLFSVSRELLEAVKFLLPRVSAHKPGCSLSEVPVCNCGDWNERWNAARQALDKALSA